ncbi:UDP-N-acetylmuramate dehydrogenase [Romeria aff. gracilis LEGE 07310]|uniref:UDP-N-acetylenolpyruvoylglucosamine reductase n=1 Tax=Vasconcelosia minhoensis LEGE 07310 TaxID=915328 RepID=A0A8J7A706_9CYAN|nr:UDP-N-acetylmuramate dehydrogenase [Romeria gracilis]MBE9077245.1 UDP-N-acetylmuramate dehydrogenase [Romeria aff. gracilis LEGE 07310]
MNPSLIDSQLKCELKANASLAELTTLRVGGAAEWLALPRNLAELGESWRWAKAEGMPIALLGAGSNLLISDRGLPGLVICTRYLRQTRFEAESGQVTAFTGEPLATLAWKAAKHGWRGLEWTAGIPGTVGGAVVMNAGAQGRDTAAVLVNTSVLELDGSFTTLEPDQLQYGYRSSILQTDCRPVVQATFQLRPGSDPAAVKADTAKDLAQRHSTQPYHLPSCGSVFRNPLPHSAGQLIEQAGLKGFQIGRAQVAQRHANFIVNLGGAKASDVLGLIRHIQAAIEQRFSVQLQTEVKIIGEF